jgi:ankyrin repeat-rich membrane spanning protein
MIVIVDGLDSAEQRKVFHVLETVHALFCDPGSPFIILLAVDPHIIAKAIESNLSGGSGQSAARAWVGGQAYLRNMVHLPFFLQAQ